MSERFDPSIKLFGKMIQLGFNKDEDLLIGSRIQPFTDVSASTDDDFYFDSESFGSDQNILCSKQRKNREIQEATKEKSMDTKQERQHNSTSLLEEPKTPTSPSTNTTKNPKTIIKHKMSLSQDHSDQASSNSKSQNETNLKKPDKILSCASSITTQNSKECSWTAGGSMRNVPVGPGTRKCKNSAASLDRHLVIPDGLNRHDTRHDGTVFAFGLDSPLENRAKAKMLQLGEGSQTVVSNRVFRSENDKKTPIALSNSNSICIEKGGNCIGGSIICWQSSTNCSPNSTSLGKHNREDLKKEALEQNELENSRVVIPKTLRFDDPFETSKSSKWTNPDTKNNHVGSSNGRLAFFGGLQQAKGVDYERRNVYQSFEGSSMVLQANPAAFLRSLALHEIAQ